MRSICFTIFFSFIWTLNPFSSLAQTIQVREMDTGKPIYDVAIYNFEKNRSVLSDENGKADISIFTINDSLYFQHPSFLRVVFSMDEIKKMNNIIPLEHEVRMLTEFVISARRWEEDKSEVPNKIKPITAKEIEFNNPQTAADLLMISNAVFLQKSQLGGGSPMIRGFAANSILLMVDGVRLNNAIYRSGNLQNVISLDANIVNHSEIIYGPGSVVYGSDALGGVVDFHLEAPVLSTTPGKFQFSINAGTRYSTAYHEKMGHFDINAGFQKWAFLSSISYSDYDDLIMGSHGHPSYQRPEYVERIENKDSVLNNPNPNRQMFSGFSQLNLMQKILFTPSEKLNLTYAFHYSKSSDVPRYDRLIQYKNNQLKYAEWYYGPTKWMMHSFTLESSKKMFFSDNTRIILAYQDYEESRHDRNLKHTSLRHRTEDVDIYSISIDLYKNFLKKHTFYYGIESVYNNVSSVAFTEDINTGVNTPSAPRYPDGRNDYMNAAAYTSVKLNIGKKITLDAGARYTYTYLHSTIIDNSFYYFPFTEIKNSNDAFNGSLGIVIRPWKGSQINVNLSSGFRAPNLDDMAKVFDSEPGNIIVPNENLEPEYSNNLDLGFLQDFNHKFNFEITGFYTLLKDALVRRPGTFNGQEYMLYDGGFNQVYSLTNASEARLYGGSIFLNAKLSSLFSITTDFTYMKGEDIDGFPVRHIPPFYGGLHLIAEKKRWRGDFYMLYNGEISNENLAPEEQSKIYMYEMDDNGNPFSPAWYTINFKASAGIGKIFTFQAGVENILDHRYRPYSSGIVAPGRNFYISLKIAIS